MSQTTPTQQLQIIDRSKEGETILTVEDEIRVVNYSEVRAALVDNGLIADPWLDPIMLAHKHEGDIMVASSAPLVNQVRARRKRTAARSHRRRWHNGIVPFTLSAKYGPTAKTAISTAMAMIQSQTCVRFVPRNRTRHRDYIAIAPVEGCFSYVGREMLGEQQLSLDEGCLSPGTIAHELMHALGFYHEQSRADRDNYVQIIWENIQTEGRGNHDNWDQFEKHSLSEITHLDEQYDYSSLMHYDAYAFSKAPFSLKTIEPLEPGVVIGQRIAPSQTDINKINKLYNCNNPRSDDDCIDHLDMCSFRAMLGLCESFRGTQRCDRTCEFCRPKAPNTAHSTERPPGSAVSNDERGLCSVWAASGNCDKYKTFMSTLCKKSCNLCEQL